MREGSRVELSLSGHGVTIGTSALAYLYDAARVGGANGMPGGRSDTGRPAKEQRGGGGQSECGRNGIRAAGICSWSS